MPDAIEHELLASDDTGILGLWASEVRETNRGAMSFVFDIRDDGTIEVVGTPENGGDLFVRRGPYSLTSEMLQTPALNEGQPIIVRREGRRLFLRIDESLEFYLRPKH